MTDRIHLVIGNAPVSAAQLSSIYASSILRLQIALRSQPNVEFMVLLRDGDALITARAGQI